MLDFVVQSKSATQSNLANPYLLTDVGCLPAQKFGYQLFPISDASFTSDIADWHRHICAAHRLPLIGEELNVRCVLQRRANVNLPGEFARKHPWSVEELNCFWLRLPCDDHTKCCFSRKGFQRPRHLNR